VVKVPRAVQDLQVQGHYPGMTSMDAGLETESGGGEWTFPFIIGIRSGFIEVTKLGFELWVILVCLSIGLFPLGCVCVCIGYSSLDPQHLQ
jgi:hypothetical protein